MGKSTIKLTRKIQVQIDLPTKEERKEKLDKLYQYQNRCFRAANIMVSHMYVQEMIKDFFYLSEGIKYKLADEKKDEDGILQRSRINTTYRMISDRFRGEIPIDILSSLNNNLLSTFNKNKSEYWQGQCSLKNFKREMAFRSLQKAWDGYPINRKKKHFVFAYSPFPLKPIWERISPTNENSWSVWSSGTSSFVLPTLKSKMEKPFGWQYLKLKKKATV